MLARKKTQKSTIAPYNKHPITKNPYNNKGSFGMEDKQIYEIIMKTQIEEYRKMLLLIDKIFRADDVLREATLKDKPDLTSIKDINNQKEEWIKELDALSLNVPKTRKLLGDYSFDLQRLEQSPTYQQMKLLEKKCQEKLNLLLDKEDLQNPAITAHLSNYKERLELDIKISEVPPEKRQIFYVRL